MPERERIPAWLTALDLACATAAGATWYVWPEAGAWPLLVAGLPWVLRWALTGHLTRSTPFDLPLALFVLSAGAAMWTAYDRPTAWSKFWLVVGGVLLFYAFANAARWGTWLTGLLGAFGAGVAVYFLATHDWEAYPAKIEALTRLGQALQAPLPALPGHRLHPNVAGGIVAMMLPFGAAWIVQCTRVRRRGAGWALAAGVAMVAVSLFGLAMTTSRGAWIALGAAAALALLWAVAGPLVRSGRRRRVWAFAALAALAAAGGAAVVVAWPGGLPGLLAALPGPSTGEPRVDLLRNTLTLVKDYPLVGAGLGGFQMLYSTYVLLLHVGYTVHSHNLVLNVAVEQGLPAVLLLVGMWVLAAANWWRAARSVRALACGAALLSLVVVVLHGQVDDALYGSRAVLLLPLPLALTVPWRPAAARLASRRWLALPALLAALLAAALVWREPLLSRVWSNLGAVHQSQAELSGYRWPEWPIQDAVRRAQDLSRPVAEFERALLLDADNATANRRLGMIELSLGRYEAALKHLEAAYRVEPGSEATRMLLGEAYLANGRQAEGEALWRSVANAQGQLAGRVWWYGAIGDAERAARLEQALESRP